MEPLFSIILPTYNRAYVLWRAIQSVLAQSEGRWELLVIDDGSTDQTPRVLEEFRDPRIRPCWTAANRGPAAARNFGARLARAPYFAYLDSDNTWHPEFLATMRLAIQQHADGELWYCGQNTSVWWRSADGTWTLGERTVELRGQYSAEDVLQLKCADTSGMVHTLRVLQDTGGWDEACRFLEDWDFFARCVLRYPDRVHWVPKALVEYRQVWGDGVDGQCAALFRDPCRNRAAWQYLVEKWRSQPGFAETAQMLTAKYLSDPTGDS